MPMLRLLTLTVVIVSCTLATADLPEVVAEIRLAAQARAEGDLEVAAAKVELAIKSAKNDALPGARLATVLAIAVEIHLEAGSVEIAQGHLREWDALDQDADRSRREELWLAALAGAMDQTNVPLTLAAADRLVDCQCGDTARQAALARVWGLTHVADAEAPAAIENYLRDHAAADASDTADVLAMRLYIAGTAGDDATAWQTRMRLATDHRHSDAAAAAALMAPPEVPEADGQAWTEFLLEKRESIIAQSVSVGGATGLGQCLLSLIVHDHVDLARYAGALIAADTDGTVIAGVLQYATTTEAATRLAAEWLVTDDPQAQPMAIESVARWCGRTGRWETLAAAAGDAPAERERTIHTERLFAESLLLRGRAGDSMRWWDRVIDERGADDFPTLLRAAEATVAAGTVPQAAGRLAAAGAGAVTSEDTSLVDLVTADLEIRRLRFDHCRAALQRVVRHSPEPAIRGRAQWMIGETHFMQEQFEPAIEAYRLVESVGGSGSFAAAALVQAGAAFEKLGRTAEASVCYQRLLARHGDSPHASEAAARIAGLPPAVAPAGGSLRR